MLDIEKVRVIEATLQFINDETLLNVLRAIMTEIFLLKDEVDGISNSVGELIEKVGQIERNLK